MASIRVVAAEARSATAPAPPARGEPAEAAWVLHADRWLLVAAKPAGCPTHPVRGDRARSMLSVLSVRAGQTLHAVHRLDRATSGVVILAKDPDTAEALSAQFRHRTIDKRYVAWTRGHPPEFGVLDHPVPDRKRGRRVPARTAFARHFVHGRYALVEVSPHTGRLHQIRRHLKHMRCPILGDVRYGKGEHNRWARAELGLWRLALHAHRLRFVHPGDGAEWEARWAVPPDLRDPLTRWARQAVEALPSEAQKGFRCGPRQG